MLSASRESSENAGAGVYGTPEEMIRVLQLVRAALTDLFHAAGLNPTMTRATARELGLSKNLVWRVGRIASTDDMLTLSHEIPPRVSVERIIKAVQDRGVPARNVESLREAMSEFEKMVEASSGDRAVLQMMLSGITNEDITKRQEGARKQAYLGQSTIWGVQAEVSFKVFFMLPSGDDERAVDLANLSGLVDLRRLRCVAWPVYRQRIYNDRGEAYSCQTEPIAPVPDEALGLPLIPEFCSQPLPKVRRLSIPTGWDYELVPDLIGNAGLVTCVFGGISRNAAPRFRDEKNTHGGLIFEQFTPVGRTFLDLLVHKDLPFDLPPEVSIFDRMTSPRGYNPPVDEQRCLPHSNKVISLGTGITGCATHHIPRYLQMLESVVKRLGCHSDELAAYRYILDYPPIPSGLIMRFELPEPPD